MVALVLVGLTLMLTPASNNHYADLANRTSSHEFKLKIEEYNKITGFLKKRSIEKNYRLQVIYGANLFIPESTPYYKIKATWREANFWESGADYVVEYKEMLPRSGIKRMNPKQKEYKFLDDSLERELENTIRCRKKICYKEIRFSLERIVIFQKYQI